MPGNVSFSLVDPSLSWRERVQTISGNLRKVHKLGITTELLPN
jgi:hypothetical protein